MESTPKFNTRRARKELAELNTQHEKTLEELAKAEATLNAKYDNDERPSKYILEKCHRLYKRSIREEHQIKDLDWRIRTRKWTACEWESFNLIFENRD